MDYLLYIFIICILTEGKESQIQDALKAIKTPVVSKELAYLEGKSFDDYINDMEIALGFAMLNRKAMAQEIVERMNWTALDVFTTIHKGAISAKKGERVIVPINMRDGSIIAIGKGNPDWNYSGPHGSGRLMSRSKAKEAVTMEAFKNTMSDVWTTSVNESTLDESPMAYKPMEEILENIQDSLEIQQIIKPLYNFKAD